MCSLVRHLAGHLNNVAHVAKDQHGANDGLPPSAASSPVTIAHWRGGEGNGTLLAIPLDQQAIFGGPHLVAFLQTTPHRICKRGVHDGLNQAKDVGDR